VPSSTAEPPKAGVTEERTRMPAADEDRRPLPSMPAGIPRFSQVRDGVASGLKPLLDGGLDWLQSNGYRTVLHVRLPGEDDSADRREVEKRGLKYLTLELSPQSLSQTHVDQFKSVVNNVGGHPLFVYDSDGMLAGGLWYLYFRTADMMSDDAARTKASALGLKGDTAAEHRAMWLAIQKYLASMP
jgi:hypothetical protein